MADTQKMAPPISNACKNWEASLNYQPWAEYSSLFPNGLLQGRAQIPKYVEIPHSRNWVQIEEQR
jgi:hypothetical protein